MRGKRTVRRIPAIRFYIRWQIATAMLLLLAAPTAWAAGDATGWLGRDITLAGWQVLILALAALATPGALALRALRDFVAPWRRYREDEFLGIRWRWRYRAGTPVDISPFCPEDDTQLIYHYSQNDNEVMFRCETCDREYGSFAGDADYVRGIVQRQIGRKLRTGEWQQVLQPSQVKGDNGHA